jgi:hypothetical protein
MSTKLAREDTFKNIGQELLYVESSDDLKPKSRWSLPSLSPTNSSKMLSKCSISPTKQSELPIKCHQSPTRSTQTNSINDGNIESAMNANGVALVDTKNDHTARPEAIVLGSFFGVNLQKKKKKKKTPAVAHGSKPNYCAMQKNTLANTTTNANLEKARQKIKSASKEDDAKNAEDHCTESESKTSLPKQNHEVTNQFGLSEWMLFFNFNASTNKTEEMMIQNHPDPECTRIADTGKEAMAKNRQESSAMSQTEAVGTVLPMSIRSHEECSNRNLEVKGTAFSAEAKTNLFYFAPLNIGLHKVKRDKSSIITRCSKNTNQDLLEHNESMSFYAAAVAREDMVQKRSIRTSMDEDKREQPEDDVTPIPSTSAIVDPVSPVELKKGHPSPALPPLRPQVHMRKKPSVVTELKMPRSNWPKSGYVRPPSPASTPQRAFFNRHGRKMFPQRSTVPTRNRPHEEMFVEVGQDIATK